MPPIALQPLSHPIRKTVLVPGSKSITNRALPLAALADGETLLTGVLFADDTWQMINALQTLGYSLQMDQKEHTVRLTGRGRNLPDGAPHGNAGFSPAPTPTLHCGNSGTTIRFLTAMLCLGQGDYILDGIARMRQRPIDQLVDQLRALGADIAYEQAAGFPPIRIRAKGLVGGGCQFADAKSSQYISAILMAAPYAQEDVIVNLLGPITSEPYVMMTLRMMEQFGAHVEVHDRCGTTVSRAIRIPSATYRPPTGAPHGNAGFSPANANIPHPPTTDEDAGIYPIEPDASNASYFLAAAAITPGSRVTITGLGKNSLQGDVAFADVLGRMGAKVEWLPEGVTVSAPSDRTLHGLDLDMNHIPDMVQTLAIVALFADGTTHVRNVANLRIKETDRLAALEAELRKLGATVETTRDAIAITPAASYVPASIKTYDDHRMAMAFAIAGLRIPGVIIENPECTAKTYPAFFEDLQSLTR